MSKDNYTVNQHYIPRCYLKGFSENGKSLFRYCAENGKVDRVKTYKICYKNNLYEIKTDDSQYINRNKQENVLGNYERNFPALRERIIEIYNMYSKETDALSDDEYQKICHWIALQMAREPQILRCFENGILDGGYAGINRTASRRAAQLFCLPDYRPTNDIELPGDFALLKNCNAPPVQGYFFNWFYQSKFTIGHSPNVQIPTGISLPFFDSFIVDNNDPTKTYPLRTIFPLNSDTLIYFWRECPIINEANNSCFTITPDYMKIFANIISNNKCKYLFFKHQPSEQEIQMFSWSKKFATIT